MTNQNSARLPSKLNFRCGIFRKRSAQEGKCTSGTHEHLSTRGDAKITSRIQFGEKSIHVLSRAVITDQDHILLCKTLDLPISFYFLPGGHVEHMESAESAVLRELMEESGAECRVKRFLGCLEYSFEPGHNSICHNHEYNFIFELESEVLKRTNAIPKLEDHIELVWMPLSKIDEIDLRAEPFKILIPEWLGCGSNSLFRSVMI